MYFPTDIHSHYSLQLGLSKPEQIANRLSELDLPGCVLADNSLSGAVQFIKAMNKAGKKPIIGYTFDVIDDIKEHRIVAIAKNNQGWKTLLKLSSITNLPENHNGKPTIQYDDLVEYTNSKNEIIIYNKTPLEEKQVETYLNDCENPFYIGAGDNFGKAPRIAITESYYPNREDSVDHKVLLCARFRSNLETISNKFVNGNAWFGQFFERDDYHIHSTKEAYAKYQRNDLKNTLELAEQCEPLDLFSKPILPPFPCPNGLSPDEHLRQLCREGWKKKIENKIDRGEIEKYVERVKFELDIFNKAGLASYFLMVSDVITFCEKNGWLTGAARGSSSGCIVSYLIGITHINPLKYGLNVERFWNPGRQTDGHISLPDIDIDIPKMSREHVIEYLKGKYGKNSVAQLVTFGTLMGRSALKEVLHTYSNLSFEEMNQITNHIPDKAAIADDLQEMKEAGDDYSVIKWCLENKPEKFKDWCFIDKEGKLDGPLSKRFEMAIRLENTKVIQSKHAAGLIISPGRMDNYCPMVLDKDESGLIAGFEMKDAEAVGLLKLDVLGLTFLDKVMSVTNILSKGHP